MAELKTKETDASVEAYFDAIADDERRRDCRDLAKLMTRVAGYAPKMWGTSIVGFGSYHYKYASGHQGDACLIGFSSRKSDISLYLLGALAENARLLARLGKHKAGKGCLYVRKLSDVDLEVLEQLVAASIADSKRRTGETSRS
jgi:hypothetical protein